MAEQPSQIRCVGRFRTASFRKTVVARTEKRWIVIMATMLLVMMAVIVVTGITGALHPSSNVEVIEPTTLHLQGEFVESNLGTAIEPDGSVTVRLIAEQLISCRIASMCRLEHR